MTCAILGITEAGIRCVLNGDPCSEPSFLGRSRSGVAAQWPCQASIFHDTRLASVGFANLAIQLVSHVSFKAALRPRAVPPPPHTRCKVALHERGTATHL